MSIINQTAEYALRAVVFLASHSSPPANRLSIASGTCVPNDYLTKVLRELVRARLVSSQRGPGGGYGLMVPADKLTVFDVIQAVSSLPRIESCPLGIAGHKRLCPLHKRLDEAAELVEQAFKETKIADLIPQQQPRSACRFPEIADLRARTTSE
jgi:Rrf2 family protein